MKRCWRRRIGRYYRARGPDSGTSSISAGRSGNARATPVPHFHRRPDGECRSEPIAQRRSGSEHLQPPPTLARREQGPRVPHSWSSALASRRLGTPRTAASVPVHPPAMLHVLDDAVCDGTLRPACNSFAVAARSTTFRQTAADSLMSRRDGRRRLRHASPRAPVIAYRHIALASNLHRQAARSPAVFPDVPWPSAPRARTPRQKYLPQPARHRSRGNPGSFIGLAGPRALSCPAPSTRIGRRLLKKGIATPDQAITAIWCSPAVPRTPSRLSGTPCAAGVAGEPQRKLRKPTSCAGEHGARCCSEHAKRPFCPSRGAAVRTWSGIWTDAIVKGTVTAA
jgi:hypothetical protein